jgi:putative oxidoreductase
VAVGDRFGWLGPYGSKNVSWGDGSHFVQYVALLNSFVPKSLIPGLAVLETVIELGLGIALLLGIYQRVVAWSSAALLLSFALTMSIALGIVAPLSYSVFTALGAALLLGAVAVPHTARSSAGTHSNSRIGKFKVVRPHPYLRVIHHESGPKRNGHGGRRTTPCSDLQAELHWPA